MMIKHRGKLVLFVLAPMVMVATVIGKQVLYPSLPHPSKANREQLFRWMLRDLSAESPEIQSAIVDRIEEEIIQGVTFSPDQPLPGARFRKHLLGNIELLEQRWFDDRIARYQEASEEERILLLDREIAVVWQYADLGSQAMKIAPPDLAASLEARPHLHHQIDAWIQAREGESRQIAIEVYEHAIMRWLATFDFSNLSLETRKCLANEFAAQFDKEPRPKDSLATHPESEQIQLRKNGLLLMEAWLHARAEEYQALPEESQSEFIEKQINHVVQWNLIELLGDHSESEVNPWETFQWLDQTTQIWIERSEPASREPFEALIGAIKAQLINQYLHPGRDNLVEG